jgi:(S)-2-hydroxyglutarate dehydrogenase
MPAYEILIAGGGIIGLSTAFQIQKKFPGKRIAIVEKESKIGQHQSGHNSGVIHSGIYYPPGSLKAENCLKGYELLLNFCRENEIKHEICGKIIVATNKEEVPALKRIRERGEKNGLSGLKDLDVAEMKEIEPHVKGLRGLKVPQTGIVDFKQMMQVLAEKIQNHEGEIILDALIEKIETSGSEILVHSKGKTFQTKLFINCAGLYSDRIAKRSGMNPDIIIIPFRGEYFKLREEKNYLVKNLIYPVPDPGFPFLGVHFTRMIGGGIEAGPNAVLAYAREGYKKSDINISELMETLSWPGFQKVASKYWKTGLGEFRRSYSKNAFTRALQKLIPEIRSEDLIPGGSGVRAQACDRKGGLLDDFSILQSQNMIHVLNAPSPAATSSLSIGEHIADMV